MVANLHQDTTVLVTSDEFFYRTAQPATRLVPVAGLASDDLTPRHVADLITSGGLLAYGTDRDEETGQPIYQVFGFEDALLRGLQQPGKRTLATVLRQLTDADQNDHSTLAHLGASLASFLRQSTLAASDEFLRDLQAQVDLAAQVSAVAEGEPC